MFERYDVSFEYPIYVERYIGFDDRDGYAAIAKDHGITLSDDVIRELIDEKAVVFEEMTNEGIPPCRGILALIADVSQALPLAIGSGATRQDIEVILKQLGDGNLKEKFGAIVTADDVARSKPDPMTYLQAAEAIGVDPKQCLAIEDTTTGLRSARGAGMHTLAVETTYPASVLNDYADRVVNHLEEVNLGLIREWYG